MYFQSFDCLSSHWISGIIRNLLISLHLYTLFSCFIIIEPFCKLFMVALSASLVKIRLCLFSYLQAGVVCIDSSTTMFLVPSSKLTVHLGKLLLQWNAIFFVPLLFLGRIFYLENAPVN